MLLFVIIFLISCFYLTLSELFLNVYGGLSSRFPGFTALPASSFPFFAFHKQQKLIFVKSQGEKQAREK